MIPEDTTPEAFAVQARLLRALTTGERLAKAMRFCDEIRALCAAGVRRRNPGLGDDALRAEVSRILLQVGPGLD